MPISVCAHASACKGAPPLFPEHGILCIPSGSQAPLLSHYTCDFNISFVIAVLIDVCLLDPGILLMTFVVQCGLLEPHAYPH